MSDDVVLYEVEDHVATITLNRTDALNAYNNALRDGIVRCFRQARDDDDVWVIIFTGAGRSFCAGIDLKANRDEMVGDPTRRTGEDFPYIFRTIDKPIICAINGWAIGVGFEMTLHADFRIMAENAILDDRHVKIGLVSDIGGQWLLQRQLGAAKAAEVLLLGERIDAKAAERLGLVYQVVPADQLMQAARDLAERLTASAPLAVQQQKRLLRQAETDEYGRFTLASVIQNGRLRTTADTAEGLRSFLERRPAVYVGR